MGAQIFCQYIDGTDAEDSFFRAREAAAWEYGHAGYTGSLAEKDDFIMIDVPKGRDPEEYANELIDNGDPRIDAKWGPAGCIRFKKGFLFFGWASS